LWLRGSDLSAGLLFLYFLTSFGCVHPWCVDSILTLCCCRGWVYLVSSWY
jgi:hypothetical protein